MPFMQQLTEESAPYDLLAVDKSNSLNNETDYAPHVHCERSLHQIHAEMKFYLDQ